MSVAFQPHHFPDHSGGIGARVLAQKLGLTLGQNFVVENKTGASGMIGAEFVAKSDADGYARAAMLAWTPPTWFVLLTLRPKRTVNAAAEEDIETACVHDSFSCLAPDADRFNKIIRTQLAMLYAGQDHLRTLRDYSAVRHSSVNLSLPALRKLALANFAEAYPLPAYGSYHPISVQDAEYCWA